MDKIDAIRKFQLIMSGTGTASQLYACSRDRRFQSTPCLDRTEYERRAATGEASPEAVQVLRYLSLLTYADFSQILAEANNFRRAGLLPNVVTDEGYLRKLIKVLVYRGLIVRRTYLNPAERTTASGDIISDSPDDLQCYCLTDKGGRYLKDRTESTIYLEEHLINKSPIEVMRRLSCNMITQKIRTKYSGTAVCCTTEKVGKVHRNIIYGQFRSETDYVLMEPVFFSRSILEQTEDELEKHYEERIEFLDYLLHDESIEGKRLTLILVTENGESENLKKIYQKYRQITELVSEVYFTSVNAVEFLEKSGTRQAPFLNAVAVGDHSDRISLDIKFPSFLLKNT